MSTTEEVSFHVDDVCTSKSSNQMAVGYVDRTHAEIDSHSPNPIGMYGKVHRHRTVPRNLFKDFLRDGVPPKGYVLMQWQTESKAELVPCSDLVLLDRTYMSGDLVRQGERSGTVISTRTSCTLLSMCDVKELKSGKTMKAAWLPFPTEGDPVFELSSDGSLLYNVPASELKPVQTYNEGDIIIYRNWVGRIKDCFDEITVRLSDNGVVTIPDDHNLEPVSGDLDERFAVGSLVKTKKGILRTGRWVYGSYSPNTAPVGVVVDVRTKECQVEWLHQWMAELCNSTAWNRMPESFLGLDELDSGKVHIYDVARIPHESGADCKQTKSRSDPEYQGGIRVKFRDIAGACVKYDGSTYHGKLERLERRDHLGYDLNVFTITATITEADVLWGDMTTETVRTTSIEPDSLIDDEDAIFTGEIVCSNDTKPPLAGATADWTITPARVGIAERVNAKDRIAEIRWFKDSKLSFCDKELTLVVGGSTVGAPGDVVEEVSFYDIRAPKSVNRDRGDFVLLLQKPNLSEQTDYSSVTWFGEVVDLGMDGRCTVRLGAAEPCQEVECYIVDTLPAMNRDLDEGPLDDDENMDAEMLDYMAEGSDEEGYDDSDFDMDAFEEPFDEWYEEGQNVPIDDADDSWSTESEEPGEDYSDAMSNGEDALTTEQPEPEEPQPTVPVEPTLTAQTNGNGTTGLAPSSVPLEELNLSSLPNAPAPYEMLDSEVPAGHHFWLQGHAASANNMKSVQKEHRILSAPGALPEGVYVRTWESRMDLIRVLFVGPLGTPYEYAPFVIDLHLPPQYPYEPPKAFFHSWTAEGAGMSGRVNPNLYEEGKICLSLLGTWQGDESRNEAWAPNKSTVLQVLVSILGLVLVKEPYYNEAGYEPLQGLSSFNQNSSAYTERTYLRARAFLISPISRLERGETAGLEGLEGVLRWLYMDVEGAGLMAKAIKACKTILDNSEGEESNIRARDGLTVVSRGAALPLKRVTARLQELAHTAQ